MYDIKPYMVWNKNSLRKQEEIKIEATRKCGHVEIVDVFYKNSDREKKIAWCENTVCAKTKNMTNAIMSGVVDPELMNEINLLQEEKNRWKKKISTSVIAEVETVETISRFIRGFMRGLIRTWRVR